MDEPNTGIAQMDEPNTDIVDRITKNLELLTARLPPLSASAYIYRVPSVLRSVNEEAYTPMACSIGPFHHGTNKNLQMMEESKLRLLNNFIKRTGLELNEFVKIVADKKKILCDYYHGSFTLINIDFVQIILVDAIFIVELFLTIYSVQLELQVEREQLLDAKILLNEVERDLLLLENQVPFFILEEFWKCVTQEDIKNIFYHHFNFKVSCYLEAQVDFGRLSTPRHLVDLLRNLYIPLEPKSSGRVKTFKVPNVTDLHLAGVKLTVMESSDSLFDIRFCRGSLKIPKLMIIDSTEIMFRNLIAFEQCHFPFDKNYICHYVTLIDFFIDTHMDVDLLVKKKIVENWMGDSNYVSEMINKLGNGVIVSEDKFYFAEILNNLNSHCEIPCNIWMATLKQKYFNTPWAIVSLCGAIFLIILTIIQALCAIIPLVKKM